MKNKTKHSLLAFFSLVLLLASLLLMMPVQNKKQAQDVRFGYPIAFVSQDFTHCEVLYFFPWYLNFKPYGKCKIKKIYPVRFLVSWLLIFSGMELLIYILEIFKFWISSKILKR